MQELRSGITRCRLGKRVSNQVCASVTLINFQVSRVNHEENKGESAWGVDGVEDGPSTREPLRPFIRECKLAII